MVLNLLGLLLLGLIAGGVARLFIRSPQRLGCLGTALLGVVGSYAGGSLGAILFDDKFDLRKAATLIGAIAGSIVVLAIWRVFDRRPRR
ncbi:MAG: GlsB/YeaQ/YmgE family stress response membrane protein [Jatrophihabitantaceae bacterium]